MNKRTGVRNAANMSEQILTQIRVTRC